MSMPASLKRVRIVLARSWPQSVFSNTMAAVFAFLPVFSLAHLTKSTTLSALPEAGIWVGRNTYLKPRSVISALAARSTTHGT